MDIHSQLENVLGRRPSTLTSLHGGCVASVERVDMPGGDRFVVKHARQGSPATFLIEARMLNDLRATGVVPVPEVIHASEHLLLMEYVDSDGHLDGAVEDDLARITAALHNISSDSYGYDYDTVIGPLPQSNKSSSDWIKFFREERLMNMSAQCMAVGRYDSEMNDRILAFCDHLGDHIEAKTPSFLHGDLWGGNILCSGGRVTGLIDPAIYYGIDEVELAFMTLFSSVSRRFFDIYGEMRPIESAFLEERRDIYNLWPLLVHVRLFGGSYLSLVDRTLARYGC